MYQNQSHYSVFAPDVGKKIQQLLWAKFMKIVSGLFLYLKNRRLRTIVMITNRSKTYPWSSREVTILAADPCSARSGRGSDGSDNG